MQRRSIYKRKAGALFMDTRPVYFGKNSFSYALAVLGWRALSRNALAQRKDGYKRQKAETAPFGTASALYLLPVFENVSQR